MSRATLNSEKRWTHLDLEADSTVWAAFQTTFGTQSFASFRITRYRRAPGKRRATTRPSSNGSSFSQRSTTHSSFASIAPTEARIVLSRLPEPAAPPMASYLLRSSLRASHAFFFRPPVSAWVDWGPAPVRVLCWVGYLSGTRIFAIFAYMDHV